MDATELEFRRWIKTLEDRLKNLEARQEVTQSALSMLVSWMSQSANSPIRADEAYKILQVINME